MFCRWGGCTAAGALEACLLLIRCEPAVERGVSVNGEDVYEGPAEIGLSESLSRLFEGVGLCFGSGRSPTHASSNRISLQVH
jgi:hypothetical protein